MGAVSTYQTVSPFPLGVLAQSTGSLQIWAVLMVVFSAAQAMPDVRKSVPASARQVMIFRFKMNAKSAGVALEATPAGFFFRGVVGQLVIARQEE